jgi:FkbM family methyltransferase
MRGDLIYDIGMHVGKDTEFYLQKGFSVVAVEANPELVPESMERFSKYLEDGRLRIINAAISDRVGTERLYVSDAHTDWSTLHPEVVADKQRKGASFRTIKVDCVDFSSILSEHGIPYYMKIDIEGADLLCLVALRSFGERPPHISIEATAEHPFMELFHLYDLGYRQFKFVNQALNRAVRPPFPAREGAYVETRFSGDMSGLFGEETPGEWMGIERAVEQNRRILARYRAAASDRLWDRVKELVLTGLTGEPSGWHDIHAKL